MAETHIEIIDSLGYFRYERSEKELGANWFPTEQRLEIFTEHDGDIEIIANYYSPIRWTKLAKLPEAIYIQPLIGNNCKRCGTFNEGSLHAQSTKLAAALAEAVLRVPIIASLVDFRYINIPEEKNWIKQDLTKYLVKAILSLTHGGTKL